MTGHAGPEQSYRTADVDRLRQALEGFEARLRSQRAPVAHSLRPGLSQAELASLTRGLPFRLPAELRTWFLWHDGAEGDYQLPVMDLFPLADALAERQYLLEHPIPADLHESMGFMRPGWLPIGHVATCTFVANCDVADLGTSSIHALDVWFGGPHWDDPLAGSLLEMVELWNRLLDDGLWRFAAAAGEWDQTREGYSPELRATRLA